MNAAPTREGPRVNELITVREVRVIDAEGENRGVLSISDAMKLAEDSGLDLVEISP
ncbi:MAG: translation initiation factor IF-3, partial [Limibacillus sp.]